MNDQNRLGYSVITTFGLIICLGLLYLVPQFDLGSLHFKRVNILSDIVKKDATPAPLMAAADTDAVVIKPIYVDTCKRGVTCVEDYSADSSGMKAFLAGLDSANSKVIRIAYFADSYVEGDIMLEHFRDTMQSVYGGSGVGFVPITSEVAGFRQTVNHTFQHWDTYSIVGNKSPDHPLGPAGFAFVSQIGSEVSYKASSHKHLNSFPVSELFYRKCDACSVVKDNTDTIALTGDHNLNAITLCKDQRQLSLTVNSANPVDLYGVCFEDTKGVSVDNFSMRGNSGYGLNQVSEEIYRTFDSIHPYKLVVLSYGLNVANEKAQNYTGYGKTMNRVVQRIKAAFPGCSILLVGCSDRGAKVDGDYKTMPTLDQLVAVQRKVAADNGICFWNLYEAMGGDSTMVRWVNMTPPLANKDYTHLNYRGGKKVADILMNTILYEKEKYDRKKKIQYSNLLSQK